MIYKNSIAGIALLSSTLGLFAADDFVRQTDLSTDVIMDVYVAGPDGVGEEDGDVAGAMPVGASGARFQLFGIGLAPDTNLYLLDETVTGAHIPTGVIETKSADPYESVTRTRADIPFQAQLDFSNIQTDDDAPLSSKYLYVERLVVEYSSDEDRLPLSNEEGENLRVVESFFVNNNGTTAWTDIETSLQSEFEHKQKGEERIRIYALPNEDLTWYVIDEKTIHVWPIADATMTGSASGDLDSAVDLEGQKLASAPTIYISAQDLYPSSINYVRIYKGEVSDLAEGAEDLLTIIASEYEVDEFHTVTPQDLHATIPASEIQDFVAGGGTFTAELVTRTPFNEGFERLTWATFEVSTRLKIRGSINSQN